MALEMMKNDSAFTDRSVQREFISSEWSLLVGIQSKVLNNNCPAINSNKGQLLVRHQRFVLAFSNAVLKLTPKIKIPIELTGSVETGIKLSLPITIKFQSKFDLITNWLNQISTTTSGVTNSFTSLAAALTQLLGSIPPLINVPTTTAKSVSGSSTSASSSFGAADDTVNRNTVNSFISSANNSNTFFNGRNFDDKNINEIFMLSHFANTTRAKSRAKLYESIELSHSKLGKACLLRAICEVAQTPLMAPNSGIIGEIIDMFLTLSPLYNELTYFDDYSNAQTVGRNSFLKHSKMFQNYTYKDECRTNYGIDCPFSLFNINHIIPII